jgi:hypothetical protein
MPSDESWRPRGKRDEQADHETPAGPRTILTAADLAVIDCSQLIEEYWRYFRRVLGSRGLACGMEAE